ncbi:Fimbrial adapter PapK precursor [compost metagenome]
MYSALIVPRGLLFLSLLMPFFSPHANGDENLHFRGTLVAEPCTLHPDDEVIDLDFGNVVDKYLYANQRTAGKPFAIRLMECDTSFGGLVEITLQGMESTALPGLLALNASGSVEGIAIGFESVAGEIVPINKSYRRELKEGSNVFNLQAYVRAEPESIKNKNIKLGSFSAISTFILDYP